MSLTQTDLDRFKQFLEGEKIRAPITIMNSFRIGEFTDRKRIPIYKQIIRLYCQRYDCYDQYDQWVEFLGKPYKKKKKGDLS